MQFNLNAFNLEVEELHNPRRDHNLTHIGRINNVLLNPNLSFELMLEDMDGYMDDILLLADLIYGMPFSRTDDIDYKEFLKAREIFFEKVNTLPGGFELFPQLLD